MLNYKRLSICIIVVLIGIGSAVWFMAITSKPKLEIDNAVYDFGVVPGDTDVSHSFVLKNVGRKPLIISQLTKSCGCVRAAHMKDGNVIMPGKEGSLSITYHTTEYESNGDESIDISTNDPKSPVMSVRLKAKSHPVINIQPFVLNFGVIRDIELPQQELVRVSGSFKQLSNKRLQIVSSNPFINVEVKSDVDNHWVIKASLKNDCPIGPLNGDITVYPNLGPPRHVNILGQVIGDVSADPPELLISTKHNKNETVRINGDKYPISSVQIISPKNKQVSMSSKSPFVLSYTTDASENNSKIKQILLKVLLKGGSSKIVAIPVVVVP